MNTNQLKKFAQGARRELLKQVAARLDHVLKGDTPELREKFEQVKSLKKAIDEQGKEQLIDKVTYTWFNRLVALRFMDVNDYQPLGIRVITPQDGFTIPELLQEARQGHIPEELRVDSQRVSKLMSGSIPAADPQNEAYRLLFIASCNHLNKVFPFLFENINDWMELLLPDDLISELSVLELVRNGMRDEDSQEVEIIGWLYQFYISERKDELINAKKRYKADEIAPVTQLFTPKWIVQYMVDNTLGQFWKEARPNTNITKGLEYYIKPNNPELIPLRDLKSLEDIKFFDPCVGSAHVLCYAYDIFYKIYEEEGYNPTDIPELIITRNLYGIDIDDRAAQLASFALMMKGRKNHRRFFRKQVTPNITAFQNIESHPKFEYAKVLGSLIKMTKEEVNDITVDETSLFAERDVQLKKQASLLAYKYDIVVTNPPYLNSSYMEGTLKQFVEKEYKTTKSDLFACFLVQVSYFTKEEGLIGFICPYVWMFIKSYEWLRENTIENTTIASLIQLEYNAFGPAVVPIATFVLRNHFINDYKGSYIKLSEFKGVENQKPRTLQAIRNPECGWFYESNQSNFQKIPGRPIGYWLSDNFYNLFRIGKSLKTIASPRQGIATANNNRFLRGWHEVTYSNFSKNCSSVDECITSRKKWYPYNKGGSFRKWFGNNFYVINWFNNGNELKTFSGSVIRNPSYFFKEGLTWTSLTVVSFNARFSEKGFLFDSKGPVLFQEEQDDSLNYFLLGMMNSNVINEQLKVLSPTLDYNQGPLGNIALPSKINFNDINSITNRCIESSKLDWNSRETSWGFNKSELIRINGQDLEESYDLYQHYWRNKFFELHKNEEELNRQFIEIYGLQEELTPEVALKDITILKEETKIVNGQLKFQADEVFQQFISYAVGCMFGRYSLDAAGLILANQGEALADYLKEVEKSEDEVSFLPDDDSIIPVLADEWFTDDVTGRLQEFLKVTFAEERFSENLVFVEKSIGKDIRSYFLKDFYNYHIKRYKRRPIYWLFASERGAFNVLIYMHRYTTDTLNVILNDYLRPFIDKLKNRVSQLEHIERTGEGKEKTLAIKEMDKLQLQIKECETYERDVLYPLASKRIEIDLDDGVLVNYNKFGKAVKEVKGLNDTKTKEKVRGFDWIDASEII